MNGLTCQRTIKQLIRAPRYHMSARTITSVVKVTSPISKHNSAIRPQVARSGEPSRWYSVEPRLKSSGFATPKMPEASDLDKTKLVHGKTNMKLGITDRASNKLNQIAKDDNNPDSGLLIKVESGGCHGFQYDIKLTTVSEEVEKNPELLVFQRENSDNEIVAQVIIDESSLQILQESKLDYTKELIGSQFKMVDSPYTTSACGCGSSFDFDFDKLAENQK